MIFGLFRRSANEAVVDRLYDRLVEASRRPALYIEMGVPDTFEGRFESLTLHAGLVLRRLRAAERPGPDLAQHLVDTVFKHFDRTLREMGVGDTSVPKRMKGLAEAFLGRSKGYDEALRADRATLAQSLGRNIYGGAKDGRALAAYVSASVAGLETQPLQAFIDGAVLFPDPAAFAAVASDASADAT